MKSVAVEKKNNSCSAAVSGWWSLAVLESGSLGILPSWSLAVLESFNLGILPSWSVAIFHARVGSKCKLGCRTRARNIFFYCVVTVAILAQGTNWADAVTQAFLFASVPTTTAAATTKTIAADTGSAATWTQHTQGQHNTTATTARATAAAAAT